MARQKSSESKKSSNRSRTVKTSVGSEAVDTAKGASSAKAPEAKDYDKTTYFGLHSYVTDTLSSAETVSSSAVAEGIKSLRDLHDAEITALRNKANAIIKEKCDILNATKTELESLRAAKDKSDEELRSSNARLESLSGIEAKFKDAVSNAIARVDSISSCATEGLGAQGFQMKTLALEQVVAECEEASRSIRSCLENPIVNKE